MIQLSSRNLTPAAESHLNTVQDKINRETTFARKVAKAHSEWDSKISSAAKQAAFDKMKETLIGMCVGVEICNYCELSEAIDIEHIYPKSFFPERAFRWDNYLLACKTCNSGYKLDKFAVFDPLGSAAAIDLIRAIQPTTDDAVMIDPRRENPLDFFYLDIVEKTFILDPRTQLNSRDKKRAEYTLDLLKLNDRTAVVEARKSAAKYYLDRLERYCWARDASNFIDLERSVQDPDFLVETLPLEQEKVRICLQIREDIKRYAHPTVWQELKRQRQNPRLRRTNTLFTSAPEALEW